MINKLLTHNRDKEGDFGIRVLLHIPAGIMMGLLDWNNGLVKLFKVYELNEDAHTHDQAWKDVFGAMVGWVIGRLLLTGTIAFLVWHFLS